MTDVELVEKLKSRYAELIPDAVRQAILECVYDLAWAAGPAASVRWSANHGDQESQQLIAAFDTAIDEFTDHLKKTLLLDPKPYGVRMDGVKIHARFEVDERLPGDEFAPRVGYSQDRKDYA